MPFVGLRCRFSPPFYADVTRGYATADEYALRRVAIDADMPVTREEALLLIAATFGELH